MRKGLMLTVVLLLSAAAMILQSSTFSSSQTENKTDRSLSQNITDITVEGCLGRSGTSYMLTEQSGRIWYLRGDDDLLKSHVGHQMSVTGISPIAVSSVKAPSNIENNAMENSNATPQIMPGSNPAEMLHVKSVKQISDTCTNGPRRSRTGSATNETQTPGVNNTVPRIDQGSSNPEIK